MLRKPPPHRAHALARGTHMRMRQTQYPGSYAFPGGGQARRRASQGARAVPLLPALRSEWQPFEFY
jgi:hypothetical protein